MNVRFASIIPLERRIKWEQRSSSSDRVGVLESSNAGCSSARRVFSGPLSLIPFVLGDCGANQGGQAAMSGSIAMPILVFWASVRWRRARFISAVNRPLS